MRWSNVGQRQDPVSRAMEVVGERWTLLILQEAFGGIRRFEQFSTRLGLARNILAARLQRLVQQGIFDRVLYSERPVRHEYVLTDRGRALHPVILTLMQWSDRWLAGAGTQT